MNLEAVFVEVGVVEGVLCMAGLFAVFALLGYVGGSIGVWTLERRERARVARHYRKRAKARRDAFARQLAELEKELYS